MTEFLNVFLYLIIFILGLLVGSFLNLVSDRLENGKSVFWGRSACDFCGVALKVSNLIPVLSFLFQRGKCGECQKKLTFYYPFSEILTGITFLLIGNWLQISLSSTPFTWFLLAFHLIVAAVFIIIFLSDLKFMIVPDKVVLPGILFVFLVQLGILALYVFNLYSDLNNSEFGKYLIKGGLFKSYVFRALEDFGLGILVALCISLLFLFLIYITKGRGMGGGDVKLGFLIGLINGFPNGIIAIFLGFLTGALYSVILILGKKKSLKDSIAFGPFLIIGNYLALFYGKEILDWYIKLF